METRNNLIAEIGRKENPTMSISQMLDEVFSDNPSKEKELGVGSPSQNDFYILPNRKENWNE